MSDCRDCFKTERQNAEQFEKIKDDAKKYSEANEEKVAIIHSETGYSFTPITTRIPAGTIEIIMPGI